MLFGGPADNIPVDALHGANAPIRSGRSSKARTEADTSSERHPSPGVRSLWSQTSVQPSSLTRAVAHAGDRNSTPGSLWQRCRGSVRAAGSAAAISINDRVSSGRTSSRWRKLSSTRAGTACSPAGPKPACQLRRAQPACSSSNASGSPRASANSRSRTWSSSPNRTTECNSARASSSCKPQTSSSGSPRSSSRGSRATNISPTEAVAKFSGRSEAHL